MYNTYASDYTTYERVNAQLKASQQYGDLTNDSDIIKQYIHVASDQVREFCNRTFVPYISDSVQVDYSNLSRFWILELPDDAQTISQIQDANDTTVSSSYYRLRDTTMRLNGYPSRYVDFANSTSISFTDADDFAPTFSINGIWGYSGKSYANSWDVITTTSATITASQTTIAVADSSALEVFDYIRIESEFLQITANNTATDTITVTRGVNGSTASSHDGSVTAIDIERWHIEDAVKDATTRLTAYLYGSRQAVGNTIVFQDGTVAQQYPSLVWSNLSRYQRMIVESV